MTSDHGIYDHDTYAEAMNAAMIVCPSCGSSDIGTVERAFIWQRCSFDLAPEAETAGDVAAGFEDEQGRVFEPGWEAYDSDDVGDTETVGFYCRGCITEWDLESDGFPFITRAEYDAKTA